MGSSSPFFLKVLIAVLAVVGFSWFLLVDIVASGGKNTATFSSQSSGNLKHLEVTGRKRHVVHPAGFDLNYMSKRRVPNGPDPIHNRRAGNSKHPPGQA